MRLFIEDYSLICALGENKEEILNSLLHSKSSYQTTPYELVDGTTTPAFAVTTQLLAVEKKFNSRNNRLLMNCLSKVAKSIHKHIEQVGHHRVGVVFGTSTSGIDEGANAVISRTLSDYDYYLQEMSSPSDFISNLFGLKGISYTISTACSSGARAFIEGARLIENGFCDSVIVGACDTLNPLTLNGFNSLEAIDKEHARPFQLDRAGINIGEGAAVFVLSKVPSQIELLGHGESSDAFHPSAPHPEGRGAIMAMEQALAMAKLSPKQIDYINLHGTGTDKNDDMESLAISHLFNETNYRASTTKPFTGHCLGAAGAVELAFCALLLEESNSHGYLPPQIGIKNQDPKLQPLKFSIENEAISPAICMSNSYAFGGNNVSIIIGANTNGNH